MTMPIRPGEAVYLIPRTLGAPSAAWSRPACTVVRVELVEVTVRLGDGTQVTTHRDNVTRTPPTERTPRRPAPPTTPAMTLPAGYEEVPLF